MYKGLKEILERQKESSKIAIKSKEESLTYKELYDYAQEKASLIRILNLEHPNIAVLLPNSVTYIEWFCAIALADSVVVPLFFNSSAYEIENHINSCDIGILVSTKEMLSKIRPYNINHKMYTLDAFSMEIDVINDELKLPFNCTSGDTFLIAVTSSCATEAKPVLLSKKNIISNANAIIESLHYSEDEVFFVYLPLCFPFITTSQLIASLILGSTIYLNNENLLPRYIARVIQNEKITTLFCLPSFLKSITDSIFFDKRTLKTLKTLCFGGGVIPFSIIKSVFERFFFLNCVYAYVQTEALLVLSHLTTPFFKAKSTSVGKPLSGALVSSINHKFEFNEPFVQGEIVASGDFITEGFYKLPQKSNSVIKYGWLQTGDIGKLDNDGFIYICGKKKNVIVSAGINIYPDEIESVILMMGEVADVAVFGRLDEEFGEIPVASVVLANGENISDKQIKSFCKDYLPSHKIPYEILFSKKITRAKNGKVLRPSLVDV